MADYPYQLYWFDKTQDTDDSGFAGAVYFDEAAQDYKIGVVGSITFSFPVVEAYSAGEYSVDTAIGQSVQTSVENANAIVSKHSSATDYDKLCGYRDEICNLVSYNDEAAKHMSGTKTIQQIKKQPVPRRFRVDSLLDMWGD